MAFDAIKNFLNNGSQQIFILKGYAGTGKTTMIHAIQPLISLMNKEAIYMAPTGRAAKMLRDKTGCDATTIHKAIYSLTKYETKRHDADGNQITSSLDNEDKKDNGADEIHIYFKIKDIRDVHSASRMVIIVDEASMISSKHSGTEHLHFGSDILIDDLLTFAQVPKGAKLIFIGDNAQLPPVGDNRSAALDEEFFKQKGLSVATAELTEVIRQDAESAILTNAMAIRDVLNSTTRNSLSFVLKDDEVEQIDPYEVIERFVALQPEPTIGQSVVICFSNAKVKEYNDAIRNLYFGPQAPIQKGDVLQVIKNNYTDENPLYNGDFVQVEEVIGDKITHTAPVWVYRSGERKREQIAIAYRHVKVKTENGVTLDRMIIENALDSSLAAITLEEMISMYIDFMIRHNNIRQQNTALTSAMTTDPYYNALHVKYGYAITGHKSQGGEWQNALVDYTGRRGMNDDSLRWCYTATTRASQRLYGVNIPHVAPFDSFSFMPIKKISKMPAGAICLADSTCPYLPTTATAAQKAKCNSVAAALEEINCRLLSVTTMPYRDRYTIDVNGQQTQYDCLYTDSGTYTKYSTNTPSAADQEIMTALADQRCYEYSSAHHYDENALTALHNAIVSAAEQLDITITGVYHNKAQYYTLYGLETAHSYATIQFYYKATGAISRAMPASSIGDADQSLRQLISQLESLSCQH